MTLSIIIPYYNVNLTYLDECLHSILEQDISNCQIIIVDDGSEISPLSILEKFHLLDIKYFRQNNRGVSAARNKGIELATGEYIMFVDPDDKLEKDSIKKYIKVLNQYPEAELIITKNGNIKNNIEHHVKCTGKITKIDSKKLILSVLNHREEYSDFSSGAPWGKLFKKRYLDRNKIFFVEDLKKSEDRIFMLYCYSRLEQVVFLEESTYLYRCDNINSACNKYNSQIDIELDRTLREARKFIELNYSKDPEIDNAYLDMELNFLIIALKLKYLKNGDDMNDKDHQRRILEDYLKKQDIYEKIRRAKINKFPLKRKIILYLIYFRQVQLLIHLKKWC